MTVGAATAPVKGPRAPPRRAAPGRRLPAGILSGLGLGGLLVSNHLTPGFLHATLFFMALVLVGAGLWLIERGRLRRVRAGAS
jgi:hypothetical protein